jgi:hypothetical protein
MPKTTLATNVDTEDTFVRAAREGRLVRLTEEDGQQRTVQPLILYVSSKGKRLFHAFQVSGYSSGGQNGWKNMETERFTSAEVLDEAFVPPANYNPWNTPQFEHVVYAAPTRDGRVREPDAE